MRTAFLLAALGLAGHSCAHAGGTPPTTLRHGSLAVTFDPARIGPVAVAVGNRTVLQGAGRSGALTMRWTTAGALFGGAKPTASSQANASDADAQLVSAGPAAAAGPGGGGGWTETLKYAAVGITVSRTWTLDPTRPELVCAVKVIATSPATPAGNPTLLEAFLSAALHDTKDAPGMPERYFAPHPQAQFEIDCCPGCMIEGGAHVAGQAAGLSSEIYAPLHTMAAGVYDRSAGWGAATWLSGTGGNWSSWVTASEGSYDLPTAMTTYNPRVCGGQWEHFLFRGFTSDTRAMRGGFEYRLTLFDGEPLSFLREAAALPARRAVVEQRAHPDPGSTLGATAKPGLVMFPFYAPVSPRYCWHLHGLHSSKSASNVVADREGLGRPRTRPRRC